MVEEVIFNNRILISKLIEKYYNMGINNTGEEIINTYKFNLNEFENFAFDNLYLFGGCSIECSKKVADILTRKLKIYDDPVPSDEEEEMFFITLDSIEQKCSLAKLVYLMLKLELNERIDVFSFYHTIYLVHVIIENNEILEIKFDDIRPYDPAEDGKYISQDMHFKLLLHQIFSLSYDVPIEETLDLLCIH